MDGKTIVITFGKIDMDSFQKAIDSLSKKVEIVSRAIIEKCRDIGGPSFPYYKEIIFNQPNGTWSKYRPDFHKTLSILQLGQNFKPVATVGKKRINLYRKCFIALKTFLNIRRCYGS